MTSFSGRVANWTVTGVGSIGTKQSWVAARALSAWQCVPIVPVATVGGHDTLFVLSEGRGLAKLLNLKERMRSDVAPVTFSWPFGLALHLTPFQHVPLPAKIRTQILDPVYLDADPARLDDQEYVEAMYDDVEARIQVAMDELAERRKFPVFG